MKAEPRYRISQKDLEEMFDDYLENAQAPFQLGNTVLSIGEAFRQIHPAVYEKHLSEWLEDEVMQGKLIYDANRGCFIG